MMPPDHSPVFSPLKLGALVLTTVILASLLIPDDKELVSRLDMDGEVERLKEMAAERMKQHQQSHSEPAKEPTKPKTEADLLREWLLDSDATVREDPAIVAEKKHMVSTTTTPVELAGILQIHGSAVPADLYEALADALARRALGLGQPQVAGSILSEWNRRRPSWTITLRAVEAWRWAVKPEEALDVVDTCLRAKSPQGRAPADLEDLRISLALESNQPNRAYDIVFQSYQRSPEAQRSGLLKRLVELASTGDRTGEASLLIEKHLATVPYHTCPLPEAMQRVEKGSPFTSAAEQESYITYATALAHWMEWGGHGDKAFEPWLRLSLLGQQEAWDRVSELYVDLLRDHDYILVLSDRIRHGKSREQRGLLAQLLAQEGQAETAADMYLTALKDTTDTAQKLALLRGLAQLYEEHSQWQQSIQVWTQVTALHRDDEEALRSRAYCQVRLGHYSEAKATYLWLSEHRPNDAALHEECAHLCDSLGDEASATLAMQRMMAVPGRVSTPEEHLELAGRFHSAGKRPEQLAALRDGLVDHPESIRLRHTLAECLAEQQQHDEAVRVLAHSSLKQNTSAMNLLLEEAMEAANRHVALRFLSGAVPTSLKGEACAQYRLALLLEQSGEVAQAAAIITALRDDPSSKQRSTWHELARLCLESGDLTRAETFQKLHVDHSGKTDSHAWELLGDIYKAQERQEDSQAAYQQAIQVLVPVTVGQN